MKNLTEGNITKLILMFTLPMLLGNVFQQLYGMVDTVIVGRYVGVNALAAVGVTGGLSFLILGFVFGLCNGFGVIIAQSFGADDKVLMRKAIAMSVYLSIVMMIVVTFFSIRWARPLLEMLDTPADIIEDATLYITIIFAGIMMQVACNLMMSILRAVGDTKTPLLFLTVACFANILLDLLFVVKFNLGVAGVAYATVISQTISCILCLIYIGIRFPSLKPLKEEWKLDKALCFTLFKVGLPMALQNSVTAIGVLVIQRAINDVGTHAAAAYTAATKVEQLVTLPLSTLGFTVATFTAQNLGAKKIDRIYAGVKKSSMICLIFCIFGSLMVYLCSETLLTIFVSVEETEVIAFGKQYLDVLAIFFISLGLLFIYRSGLQGLGNTFVPMLTGVYELGCRAAVAFSLCQTMGFTGVCAANPITWTSTMLILVVAFYWGMRKVARPTFKKLSLEQS